MPIMFLILLLAAIAAFSYYLIRERNKTFEYWKNKGVTQLTNSHIIYGNAKDYKTNITTSAELHAEQYKQFKKMKVKHGGIYQFAVPQWLVIDPDLVGHVMVKDFHHFSAHNVKFSNDLFFNNLFHMDGKEWKDMRQKLTPTFTSGKMKMMFDMLLQKACGLNDLVEQYAESGETIEIKEVLARFTTDVIGTCGFGIECDSLREGRKSPFFEKGQEIFERIATRSSVNFYKLILSALGTTKRMNFNLGPIEDFFRSVVKDTVKYREENKIVKKDFLHLMIQLKNNGTIKDIINEKDIFEKSQTGGLTMEEVVGQCLLFFMAGYETSSTTMSFALLELAHNKEVQDKVRQETREVLKKYNGILSYEALQEMTYCENVIYETLRKYPPVADLPRMCTKNYTIPNSDVTIDKGTSVLIPVFALQNDPDHFPEPHKFNPDRFLLENKKDIVNYTYMPFGEGPRQCLGLRFGMMQSKAGIATLIGQYEFSLSSKTRYPPKLEPTGVVLSVQDGIWVNVKKAK